LLRQANAKGRIDWAVIVDSTVNRAHQHATTMARHIGGSVELQESGIMSRPIMESGSPEAV
jgi:hypothetical protein